ncbi:MAG: pyridoxal phosphate-dependent aminotransferase [Lachnospiraceae bacterium]|nr:pyridoxal phosphate-dependent aminotransferase [Lachnospiraceae bacterium]
MEAFDFDKLIDRRNTNSMKWHVEEGELPMWVADMDFETAPAIKESLQQRVNQGVFGYSCMPDEWAEAYRTWWKTRYNTDIQKEELFFCTGVIPAISSIIRKVTSPAEKVLVQSPVYHMFYHCTEDNGRQVAENTLIYRDGSYHIDWEDLEEKIKDPQTSLFLLCNPHNPTGQIWDRETLIRLGELCAENGVLVVSDEIHCDLTDPGFTYVPYASLPDNIRKNSIICLAPTKTFSIPGIQTAAIQISDPILRHKIQTAVRDDNIGSPNVFSTDAAIAAYTRGGPWLDSVREYIFHNKEYIRDYLTQHIPEIKAVPSEATYLLWLDCTALTEDSRIFSKFIREETGLFLSDGWAFGTGGESFLRMNTAAPMSRIQDAMKRLDKAVAAWKAR